MAPIGAAYAAPSRAKSKKTMPQTGDNAPDPQEDNRSRANIVALVFIVLLFAGGFWLFKSLQQSNDIQNCIASGRRDCIDLSRPDSKTP
jgi:hypothetical protein